MELSDRKRRILAAVIDGYIETAEPVGSRAVAVRTGLNLSSATIRNELVELTAMGYLEQPHTSAGRIPSPQGYRLYVNELMHGYRLSIEEAESINRRLRERLQQLDRLISDIGSVAAQITRYPALALFPPAPVTISRFDLIYVDANTFIIVVMLSNDTVKNKLVQMAVQIEPELLSKLALLFNVRFTGLLEHQIDQNTIIAVERAAGDTIGATSVIASFALELLLQAGSGEAFVTGAQRLLELPEFRDPDKAQRLLSYLADEGRLIELSAPESDDGVRVTIGPENPAEELSDSSVIMASWSAGENVQGFVGVVGPTRMDYSLVAARLHYFAEQLSRLMLGEPADAISLQQKNIKGDDVDDESG